MVMVIGWQTRIQGGRGGRAPSPQKFQPCFLLHGMQCTLDFRSAHCICTEHSACDALRVKSSARGVRDSGYILVREERAFLAI